MRKPKPIIILDKPFDQLTDNEKKIVKSLSYLGCIILFKKNKRGGGC